MLHLDWLGVSYGLPDDFSFHHRYSLKAFSPTNVWNNRWCLYDGGAKIATLLSSPRSSLIQPDNALFEVGNEWFYHGRCWTDICEEMLLLGAWERGISRLDLCFDFCPDENAKNIILGLATGSHYVAGKRAGSLFWSHETNPRINPMWRELERLPHCISFGHKTSGVRWKLYYKTKELLDAHGGASFSKPYIVDCWAAAGMDISNVWRLEVSIHQGNGYRYCGMPISTTSIAESAPALFTALLKSRFVIRVNEGHKDKRNDTEVRLFPYEDVNGKFVCYKPEVNHPRAARAQTIRHIVAELQRDEVAMNSTACSVLCSALREIVSADHFHVYFSRMVDMSLDEFIADRYAVLEQSLQR